MNIEILDPRSEDRSNSNSPEESKQITFEEMRRKQYVVQGPNVQSNVEQNNKEDLLYQSSGLKRGEILIDKVNKKREEINEIFNDMEDGEVFIKIFDDIQQEIKTFILHLEKKDFESIGMNLYKNKSKQSNDRLQSKLMDFEEKYKILEGELIGLRNENEEMKKTQENLNLFENQKSEYYPESNEKIENNFEDQNNFEDENNFENENNFEDEIQFEKDLENEKSEEEIEEGEIEEEEIEEVEIEEEEEIKVYNEVSVEDDNKTERERALEDVDKEITGEINEMICDLLEVIEDVNISTVEKMKVIRIFLHHTHDLLGTHEQMHFIEQSRDYNTNEGSSFMQQFPTNPREEDEEFEQGEEEQRNLNQSDFHPEHQSDADEETNLECKEEKLEMIDDPNEDYLSREMTLVEEKQLTEIKEDEGSEDYDSQDPRSHIMNQLEDPNVREYREDRGYSSLEVMHDRAGESEGKRVIGHEHENYESANVLGNNQILGASTSRQSQKREHSLHEQINELEDEKVGLKNKNIMLTDKISFLNQKLALLDTRLEEMEKSYLSAKNEKKEYRSRFENKNRQLKELRQEMFEIMEKNKLLENELESVKIDLEKKDFEVKELIGRFEKLQEFNNQLVNEAESKSQELMDLSLIRSSVNTGNTPIKRDSEKNSKIIDFK